MRQHYRMNIYSRLNNYSQNSSIILQGKIGDRVLSYHAPQSRMIPVSYSCLLECIGQFCGICYNFILCEMQKFIVNCKKLTFFTRVATKKSVEKCIVWFIFMRKIQKTAKKRNFFGQKTYCV